MAGSKLCLVFLALLVHMCMLQSTAADTSAHLHHVRRHEDPHSIVESVHISIHKRQHHHSDSETNTEDEKHEANKDTQDVKDASGSGASNDTSTPSDVLGDLKEDAKGVKIGRKMMAAVGIVVGLVICFAGYKLFRPTVFVCGFLVGGLLTAALLETMFKSKSWMETAAWVGFIVGGLAMGALVVYLYKLSIFMAGCAGGVMLAMTIATPLGKEIAAKRPEVVFVILAVLLGILGGILALKIERPLLIGSTSLVGAELFVWGIGYFAGNYPTAADLRNFEFDDYEIPSEWWAYLGGIIVMFIAGMVVQFKKTGSGDHHKLEK